jgi:uracil-DNA glycosylase
MKINLSSDWQAVLKDEIQKPYFTELMKALDIEYKTHTCYPLAELIFFCF